MPDRPPILEYSAPTRSRTASAIIRAIRKIDWFIRRRALTATDVAVGLSVFGTCLWRCATSPAPLGMLMAALGAAMMLLAFGSLLVLIIQRRWLRFTICFVFFVATHAAAGTIAIHSCPHATYLDIAWASIPIKGKACHNPQRVSPWD
jgi:hypothetical protein